MAPAASATAKVLTVMTLRVSYFARMRPATGSAGIMDSQYAVLNTDISERPHPSSSQMGTMKFPGQPMMGASVAACKKQQPIKMIHALCSLKLPIVTYEP